MRLPSVVFLVSVGLLVAACMLAGCSTMSAFRMQETPLIELSAKLRIPLAESRVEPPHDEPVPVPVQ